jgi:phage terminase small subunit
MTPKQEKFVKEYLIDLNGTQAAIRAGYSKNNADKIASQLLDKTRVKEAIQKAMDKRSERTEITADKVLMELAKIGFSEMPKVKIGPDGQKVIETKEIEGALISEISEQPGRKKVKLYDKTKALELIGRHLGMFNDKLDITGVKMVVFNGEENLKD